MRLRLVLPACLYAASLSGQSPQGQITGVVTGTVGDVVDGAEIRLVGTTHSASSDAKGWFAIRGVPKGVYVVEVRRIGFRAQRLGASIDEAEVKEVRIILERGTYELPELTVTVRRLKPIEYGWTTRYDDFFRRKQVGLGAYIMRDQIDRRGAGRTPSLLAGVRGVRLKYRHLGVSGTDVEITGCSQVSVWIDGHKQRYADVPRPGALNGPTRRVGGLQHPVKLDNSGAVTASHLERVLPSQIEMIEVYRGPAEMPAEFLDDSCAAIAVWTR